jgi:hypothetical protein
MELPIVHRDDLAPAERSKLRFAWQKRTGIGAIDESRAHYPDGIAGGRGSSLRRVI